MNIYTHFIIKNRYCVHNLLYTISSLLPCQLLTVIFKPASLFPVIGNYFFNFCPEPGAVIHVLSVAQLVDHHIIHYIVGGLHEKTVKIQIPFSRTTPPAAFLKPYGYPAVGDTDDRRIFVDFGRNYPFCLVCKELDVSRRKWLTAAAIRLQALFFHPGETILNPVCLASYKAVDLLNRHIPGCSCDHLPIQSHLQRKGFSVASLKKNLLHCSMISPVLSRDFPASPAWCAIQEQRT